MEECIHRQTIERFLCSTGLQKTKIKYKFHFVQQAPYDCGPACCWMILKWANRLFMNDDYDYNDFLQSIGTNIENGIWTIELVKVLKDYSFRCVFCTTNINPSSSQYDSLAFYRNDDLGTELLRVNNLFNSVSCDYVHIFNGKVTLDTIRDFLLFNSNGVILLLTDYAVLYPSRRCCIIREFSGHYIVLLGYNPHRKAFKVADPMRYFHHYIRDTVIEAARSADGTDNDIVFLNLE
ncbi:hypothetical protein WA588_003920 [Blastocystis sp. NMH]